MKFLFSPLFLLSLSYLSILASLPSVSCLCLEHQKSALLHFFSNRSSLPSWGPDSDCCDWEGVTCDHTTGHVIALDVTYRSISGSINSSTFAGLGSLLSLNLSYNHFTSSIPSNLSFLSKLTHLNLSNSGFNGQIPAEIGRLNKLLALDISTSYLNSPLISLKLENPNIESLLWNLSRLRKLHLDGVVISSAVPQFLSNFTDLTCLRLSSCRLVGNFPAKIFLLPKLETLDISLNPELNGSFPEFAGESALRTLIISATGFSGSLPPTFGNLRNLTKVELSACNFSGTIPSSVRKISGIVHLTLKLNRFSGPIPSLDGLTELKHLDISVNNFSGRIPSLANLRRLAVLDLSHNLFSGPIPLLDSLTAISKIVISSNNLTGEIPDRAASGDGLQNLAVLDLGNNSLHGKIPSYLFTLPSLQQLRLNQNQLDGQLNEVGNATSVLETIDLSYNKLQGQIPWSIFGYSRLKVLDLSSNKFNGSVELAMLRGIKNLTWLDLSYNGLSVNANVDGSSFPQLRKLYLGSCNLKEFPSFLRNQSRMAEMDLSNNSIDREIPNWLWNVGSGSLIYLNLSQNLLRGLQQPHNLSSSSLLTLDLHSNKLQGEIPQPPPSIVVLDYSKNNFTSTIPTNFSTSLGTAIFFSISSNNVSGVIPRSICTASNLQVLDLSDNRLSGSIPNCLGDFNVLKMLTVLNLGSNSLRGTLPNISCERCILRTLNLNGNQLEGSLPKSLSTCGSMEVLDVGNNRLSGTFPDYLNPLSYLRVLVLRSNYFSSSLSQHCNFSFPVLQIIDLSSNKFSGTLPAHCFRNLDGMISAEDDEDASVHLQFIEYSVLKGLYYRDMVMVTSKGLELKLLRILTIFKSLDLSNNKFEGEIPNEIGSLHLLLVFNMSKNQLTGRIPASFGNLSKLESLDLSENQLSGSIPSQLGLLTFLSVLNLSNNLLVGSIPTGPQLQTFTNDSFLGNPQLCGPPLSRNCISEALSPPPISPMEGEKSSESEFDWKLIFSGIGFGGGMGMILGPLLLWRKGRRWYNRLVDQLVVMIFPPGIGYYLRCEHPRVEAAEQKDENFWETETNSEREEEQNHSFCVFCTRMDARWEKVIHRDCSCNDLVAAELNVQSSS